MRHTLLVIVTAIATLAAVVTTSRASEPPAEQPPIVLSADLLELLREEMREIAAGVQRVTLSLATADWPAIEETSASIQASYIMQKKLTAAQAAELKAALPAYFKRLDAEFHQRAEKLGAAAAGRDAELAVFHYSRLVESCVRCHAEFAASRFAGFAAPGPAGHHH